MAVRSSSSSSSLPTPTHALIAIACVLGVLLAQQATPTKEEQVQQKRRAVLPDTVVPRAYDVSLWPDLGALTFRGEETVVLDVRADNVHEIVLNAKALTIAGTPRVNGVEVAGVALDDAAETCTLRLAQPLSRGDGGATLQIAFGGAISDSLEGFYRGRYTAADGTVRTMAATQFEASDARRALPCWDEPERKATFTMHITVPRELTALSNMPVVRETVSADDDGRLKTLDFAESPVMSTYLLAYVVGEFDFVEGKTKEGVTVRVYTPPTKAHLGKFALDVATWTLSYWTEYFDIGFPLPKCDMVAIPDFSAGAMENWGLVTYREAALLIDEDHSSVASKQRVSYVVAHELTHQWFGNLVTMKWWDDLWLNEGFATYMGTYATDKLFPQWGSWTSFISGDFFRALELDALESSHPIEVPVSSPAEINEIFDAISYSKGASVIRMLATYLGEEKFREGLRVYLKRFAYKNTVTKDLWQALSEVSGVDVEKAMSQWTLVMGYPLLTVHLRDEKTLEITQERMLASGAKDTAGRAWWIPLSLLSNDPKLATTVRFDSQSFTHTLAVACNESTWLKVNAGQTSVLRVKYDEALRAKLVGAIRAKAIPAGDRLGIEGDAFALAKAGYAKTSEALDLALAFENEDDYAVWNDLALGLGAVQKLFRDDVAITDRLNALVRKLFSPIAAKLGWEKRDGEADLTTQLRNLVLTKLVGANDGPTRAEALSRFETSLINPESLASDLRGAVYTGVAKHGDVEKHWRRMFEVFRNATMQEHRVSLLATIGRTTNPELGKELLKWAAESGDVRTQDFYIPLVAVGSSMPEVTWAFLQDHWEWIVKTFGSGQFLFGRIIGLSISSFASLERVAEIEAFFKTHDATAAKMQIQQALETIRSQAAWLSRAKSDVEQWLAQQTSF